MSLPAGKCVRLSRQQIGDAQLIGHLRDTLYDFLWRNLAHAQPEGDVVLDKRAENADLLVALDMESLQEKSPSVTEDLGLDDEDARKLRFTELDQKTFPSSSPSMY